MGIYGNYYSAADQFRDAAMRPMRERVERLEAKIREDDGSVPTLRGRLARLEAECGIAPRRSAPARVATKPSAPARVAAPTSAGRERVLSTTVTRVGRRPCRVTKVIDARGHEITRHEYLDFDEHLNIRDDVEYTLERRG
jgi:hypothetical protein